MTWSVKIQAITPRIEHSRREPKNVVTPLAPDSGVEKMSVPTQARMTRKPNNAPANAASTPVAECLILPELIQYERKSAVGKARMKPQRSPIKMGSALFT